MMFFRKLQEDFAGQPEKSSPAGRNSPIVCKRPAAALFEMTKISRVLFLILLIGAPAHGANYFIDGKSAASNDQNPGTELLPWRSVAKANATLLPGDTVLIKE